MSTEEIIFLVANILSIIGNLLFTSSSLFKRKNTILLLQSSNHVLSSIAQGLQNAYSGMVQDIVSLIRNIVLLFIKDSHRITKLIISIICTVVAVAVGIVLNILLNDNVWYGYFPVVATLLYSTVVTFVFVKTFTRNKSEVIIKSALIINSVLWMTYGLCIKLYAVTVFNAITLVISVVSIILIAVSVHKKKKSELELLENTENSVVEVETLNK